MRPAAAILASIGLAAAVCAAAVASAHERSPEAVRAPGYRALAYEAPEPGTYSLPALGEASDGDVIDVGGRRLRMHDLMGDKLVVLSFVYTSCSDIDGCPLATFVLAGLERRIAGDPSIGDDVRLITLSFDPQRDTPEAMRAYGERLARTSTEWRFLTTRSEAEIEPILAGYGQTVRRDVDEEGRALGTISHVLRVFLIDRARRIRNVYSTSFLHADTLASDVETLLLEERRSFAPPQAPAHTARVDLYERATRPQLGLPPAPAPAGGPITRAKIELGRKLFFDRRLSRNDTISCAMCHVPAQGFTSNELATAVGIEGRTVRRNAPTLLNVAYATLLFHDGRESRLEQQIWGPLLAANEMGNPSVGYLLDKIRSLEGYQAAFRAAFDGRGATMETLGTALASYERALLAGASPFDRWRYGGDETALSESAVRGFRLFTGDAGCSGCHRVGDHDASFTDDAMHDTGVGYAQLARRTAGEHRVELASGEVLSFDLSVVADSAERLPSDLGRYEITERPEDRWKYKTPTLRNVALTAPYMHDGSLATLRDVVEFYDGGGVPNELLDRRIHPLGMTRGEIDDLVAFLESLTGDGVDSLVADAATAPVGDPQ